MAKVDELSLDKYLDGSHDELEYQLGLLSRAILMINRINKWDIAMPGAWDGLAEAGGKYKIPAIIALTHSEQSEALEAYRNRDLENFQEEQGNTVIRVLDCLAGMEMDIVGPIIAKLKKNRTRGYRHGGKVV